MTGKVPGSARDIPAAFPHGHAAAPPGWKITTVLDHTSDMRYWKAAVAATIIIPVLIWAYSFVYRLLKGSDDVTKNKTDVLDKNDTLHK